eukprot:836569-Prorocentrum_minimum.AAC.1
MPPKLSSSRCDSCSSVTTSTRLGAATAFACRPPSSSDGAGQHGEFIRRRWTARRVHPTALDSKEISSDGAGKHGEFIRRRCAARVGELIRRRWTARRSHPTALDSTESSSDGAGQHGRVHPTALDSTESSSDGAGQHGELIRRRWTARRASLGTACASLLSRSAACTPPAQTPCTPHAAALAAPSPRLHPIPFRSVVP